MQTDQGTPADNHATCLDPVRSQIGVYRCGVVRLQIAQHEEVLAGFLRTLGSAAALLSAAHRRKPHALRAADCLLDVQAISPDLAETPNLAVPFR